MTLQVRRLSVVRTFLDAKQVRIERSDSRDHERLPAVPAIFTVVGFSVADVEAHDPN
jgi:hypothetical protein